jgi:hypothetical protein
VTSIASPICQGCIHLVGNLMHPHCAAFFDGIPHEILFSQADHRKPYPNDHGILFEPKTPADAEYAERMFEGQ